MLNGFDFLNEPIITVKAKDYQSDYYKKRLEEAAKRTNFLHTLFIVRIF